MKEKHLENSSVVQFLCSSDERMDNCIAHLTNQLEITSCKLEFYKYVPSDEQMQKLALAIESNPNLERFHLEDFNSQFETTTVELITATLKKLINLKALTYRGAFNDTTANYFSDLIKKTSSLEILSIGGCGSNRNTLKDEDAELIAEAFEVNKTLIEIDLSLNQITLIGAKVICNALTSNNKLKVLNLKNNSHLKYRKHGELVEILLANDCLQTIYLKEMTFTPTIYDREIRNERALEQSLSLLKRNSTISSVSLTLHFRPDPFDSRFFLLLHNALLQLNHLQELKLYGFPYSFFVGDYLNVENIKSFTFRGGNSDFIGHFLEKIKNFKNLESLSFGRSHTTLPMGDRDGKKLVEAVEFNTKLVNLDLSHSELNRETAKALKKFINGNKVLRSLNLSHNKMDNESIQLILDSLNDNQKIHTLNLESNSCHFKWEANFLKSLRKNTRLTSLKLLQYPEAINPESFQKESRNNYDFHFIENKISYESYRAANAVLERNLTLLKYSFYQKFILLKFCTEMGLFPFEVCQIIFDSIIFDALDKEEVAQFKKIDYPSTEKIAAISPSSEQIENQLHKKLDELAFKFANDIEISKQIKGFTAELNYILHSAKGLEKKEYQKIIEFSEEATSLFNSVLKKRNDVVFLKKLYKELKELKKTLPETTYSRMFCGVLSAVMTILLAIVETLLLPFSYCLGFYQGTKYFDDNCYRMFHSPLNPPIKIIDDLRKSFISNPVVEEISLENEAIISVI